MPRPCPGDCGMAWQCLEWLHGWTDHRPRSRIS